MADPDRLPYLRPSDLDEAQRELYEVFVAGPRQTQAGFFPVADANGVLSGPYRAMLLSPALGGPLERVGRAVRYQASLPDRIRELAILAVAQISHSDVEWRAHERLALSVGVPEATVSSLHAERPEFETDADAIVHAFTRQLLREHTVSDSTFQRVERMFGLDGLFELIVTIGYYQVIAHINNAFALVPAAPGSKDTRA